MRLTFKTLNEKMYKIYNGNILVFDYVGSLVDFLKSRQKEYRILYDKNIDTYFLCDANILCHQQMMEYIFEDCFYINYDESIDDMGWENYFYDAITEKSLIPIMFSVGEFNLGDDGYNHMYKLNFGGSLFTRDFEGITNNLSDIPDLYNYLKKYIYEVVDC